MMQKGNPRVSSAEQRSAGSVEAAVMSPMFLDEALLSAEYSNMNDNKEALEHADATIQFVGRCRPSMGWYTHNKRCSTGIKPYVTMWLGCSFKPRHNQWHGDTLDILPDFGLQCGLLINFWLMANPPAQLIRLYEYCPLSHS